jgi:hypothetical protein
MEHLAIDLGGKEPQICVRGTDGHIVEERRCSTATLRSYLASRPKSRVVVESCSEAFAVADIALTVGHVGSWALGFSCQAAERVASAASRAVASGAPSTAQ